MTLTDTETRAQVRFAGLSTDSFPIPDIGQQVTYTVTATCTTHTERDMADEGISKRVTLRVDRVEQAEQVEPSSADARMAAILEACKVSYPEALERSRRYYLDPLGVTNDELAERAAAGTLDERERDAWDGLRIAEALFCRDRER